MFLGSHFYGGRAARHNWSSCDGGGDEYLPQVEFDNIPARVGLLSDTKRHWQIVPETQGGGNLGGGALT